MMAFLNRIFAPSRPASSGSSAAKAAMSVSSDLIHRMQDASASNDPVRALMADVWAQRQNMPYITTLYESNEEMQAALSSRKPGNDNGKS